MNRRIREELYIWFVAVYSLHRIALGWLRGEFTFSDGMPIDLFAVLLFWAVVITALVLWGVSRLA